MRHTDEIKENIPFNKLTGLEPFALFYFNHSDCTMIIVVKIHRQRPIHCIYLYKHRWAIETNVAFSEFVYHFTKAYIELNPLRKLKERQRVIREQVK